jgi:hypothetical protein
VSEAIRDIVASDSWTLRYPVGPDAKPLLHWRAGVPDEDWVARGGLDDESWCQLMEQSTGLNVRKYLQAGV